MGGYRDRLRTADLPRAARAAAKGKGRLLRGPVTIDLDAKDIEVYSTRKQQVARSYKGEITGRVHAAHWAEAHVLLVGDLFDGCSDGRTVALDQVDRAVKAVRAAGTTGLILFQGDSGYYSYKVAGKIVACGGLFRLAVPRTAPLWRAVARVHDDDWIDAADYDSAQVALVDYAPCGWPEGTRVVARRVRYDVEEISADARSRRARTVGKDQLALALGGELDEVFAYSFFATNEELDLDEEIAQAEWEFRRRTRIEELFRDTAYGAGLNHLPSGSHAVNTCWMWGALLAYNLSAWLQMIAPLGPARARIATIRRLLIARAARLVVTGRRTLLRLAPAAQELIATVLSRIRRLRPVLSA